MWENWGSRLGLAHVSEQKAAAHAGDEPRDEGEAAKRGRSGSLLQSEEIGAELTKTERGKHLLSFGTGRQNTQLFKADLLTFWFPILVHI